MNQLTDIYKIDGQPMIAPDEDMELSFEDIDDADSGRDESGVMHRILVRRKVGKWSFRYTHLSREDYRYMRSILPAGETFQFTYPDPDTGEAKRCTAYLSGYSVVWNGLYTERYRNMKFNIIAC